MFDIDLVSNSAVIILILCVVLAIISKVLQRKFIDKREMNYNKEKIKELQKKMNELIKKGDDKSKKELDALQTEMLQLNTKMLNGSMKLMWFTMPVFLVAFAGMSYFFGGKDLSSFVPLPTFNHVDMFNPVSWIPTGLETTGIGFFKMYFFYYLVCSLLMNVIETIYDKIKK